MKKFSNQEKISLSMAVWLAEDTYVHVEDPMHISATGLLKSVKQIILAGRLPEPEPGHVLQDIELEDISNRVPMTMGNSLHNGIELAWRNNYKQCMADLGYPQKIIDRIVLDPDPAAIGSLPKNAIPVYLERRVEKKLGPFTISGQYDIVIDGMLDDCKSTGVYGYMAGNNDEKYRLQGSIYRWLNPAIITNDWMNIQFIFTDWSKLQSSVQAKNGYPKSRVLAHPLELLSVEETVAWMKNKLQMIHDCMHLSEDKMPDCTPEELWRKEPVYKYYKNPDAKRATKNYDDYYLANEHFVKDGSTGRLDTVHGEVKACGYCNAFPVCKQKDVYLENGTLKL